MDDKYKILAKENRIHRLKNNGKNTDSPGVIKKLERQVRKLKENN